MTNIEHKVLTMINGGASALIGYLGITNLMGYIENKSTVLQKLLCDESEITKEIYQIAEKTAEEIVGTGNLYSGLFYGTLAGIAAGAMICSAKSKNMKYI